MHLLGQYQSQVFLTHRQLKHLYISSLSLHWKVATSILRMQWRLASRETQDQVAKLTEVLVEAHPYDLPEVIALNVRGGSVDYMKWIIEEVAP